MKKSPKKQQFSSETNPKADQKSTKSSSTKSSKKKESQTHSEAQMETTQTTPEQTNPPDPYSYYYESYPVIFSFQIVLINLF